jgi:quinol monooxygenase YgiN
MVGGLKVFTVKAGKEVAFETLFAELREEIRRHEPGCLLYSLLKSRSDPRAYIVQEQYVDEDALEAHMTAPYSDTLFPAIRKLLERIEVEYFDGISP